MTGKHELMVVLFFMPSIDPIRPAGVNQSKGVDDYDVTIMSRNTGHYWYIHNCEWPDVGSVVVFHKHRYQHPYHQHNRANTLSQAVRSIKRHDRWQMNGRKW